MPTTVHSEAMEPEMEQVGCAFTISWERRIPCAGLLTPPSVFAYPSPSTSRKEGL